VVGVGYPGNTEREFDYAPLSQFLWKMPPERGADNFMRAMKQDVIPFIERTYRADPAERGIGGIRWAGSSALMH
jgi:predicted alpha/beta superfamily hydrolase